jgi:hypothetical protein
MHVGHIPLLMMIGAHPAYFRRQADSLKGPWSLHPESPVREWTQGSRSAGRPFVVAGKLYRLGQDCEAMYGYRVGSNRVMDACNSSNA